MGLSNCAKGCIACGVCTAVVLAIMIPVGILVIAPAMGQHALSSASLAIPNSTLFLPPSLTDTPDGGNVSNHVELTQTAFPFSTKLHETELIMYMADGQTCWEWIEDNWDGDPDDPPVFAPSAECPTANFSATNLAWFTMPETIIKHGVTKVPTFTVPLNVVAPDILARVSLGFIFAANFPAPYNVRMSKLHVWIVGKPKLTALGFVQIGPLKMGKKLACTYVDGGAPESTTGTINAELDCQQTDNMSDEEIDMVYDTFQKQGGFCKTDEECHWYDTTTTTTSTAAATTSAATTSTAAATTSAAELAVVQV